MRRSMVLTSLFFLIGFVSLGAASQGQQEQAAADRADVESIDAIMKAVYDVISGPAGEKRDWDRFRSLFLPEARLIPSGPRKEGEGIGCQVLSPEDYIKRSSPYLEAEGFFEQEIHRTMEQFGSVVHAFSSYESRHRVDDAEPFARGINSFQLFYDGNRWWIVTIYWTSERPDLPIPAKYLP